MRRAIGAAPIPVADIIPLTALQAGSSQASRGSAAARSTAGPPRSSSAASANVGVAFALREGFAGAHEVLAPGGGSRGVGAVAFSGTMAIGAAARAYFIRGESMRRARLAFRRTE